MELYKKTVAKFLLSSEVIYVIPPYQRAYSWGRDRWQGLANDVLNKYTSPEKKHWIGIVVTAKSEMNFGRTDYTKRQYDLIDGQQRLITLRIWTQALLDHARDMGETLEEDSLPFAQIRVQEIDKREFEDVTGENNPWRQKWKTYGPDESGIIHCYTYFRWLLWLGSNAMWKTEPEPLPKKSRSQSEQSLSVEEQWIAALEKRSRMQDEEESEVWIVSRGEQIPVAELLKATLEYLNVFELEREDNIDEEPVEIFEALNGKRTQLDQFDHVKTFIFANVKELESRYRLYEDDWKEFEIALEKETRKMRGANKGDLFLYDYLISLGETRYQSISMNRTAASFTRYFKNRAVGSALEITRNDFLKRMRAWIAINRFGEPLTINGSSFELPRETIRSLHMINALSQGPVTPLLMRIISQFFEGQSSESDLNAQLKAVETFVGRLVMSRVPLSPLRAELMNFMGEIDNRTSHDSIIQKLREISPSDEKIREALLGYTVEREIRYRESANIGADTSSGGLRSRQTLAIFQSIEAKRSGPMRHNLLETTSSEKFTVEHIYPKESESWSRDVRSWGVSGQLLDRRKHVIGNLGIIPSRLNSQMQNNTFSRKRDISRDPENHFPPLKVNEYWTRETQLRWTPDDIDRRSEQLVASALEYWNLT